MKSKPTVSMCWRIKDHSNAVPHQVAQHGLQPELSVGTTTTAATQMPVSSATGEHRPQQCLPQPGGDAARGTGHVHAATIVTWQRNQVMAGAPGLPFDHVGQQYGSRPGQHTVQTASTHGLYCSAPGISSTTAARQVAGTGTMTSSAQLQQLRQPPSGAAVTAHGVPHGCNSSAPVQKAVIAAQVASNAAPVSDTMVLRDFLPDAASSVAERDRAVHAEQAVSAVPVHMNALVRMQPGMGVTSSLQADVARSGAFQVDRSGVCTMEPNQQAMHANGGQDMLRADAILHGMPRLQQTCGPSPQNTMPVANVKQDGRECSSRSMDRTVGNREGTAAMAAVPCKPAVAVVPSTPVVAAVPSTAGVTLACSTAQPKPAATATKPSRPIPRSFLASQSTPATARTDVTVQAESCSYHGHSRASSTTAGATCLVSNDGAVAQSAVNALPAAQNRGLAATPAAAETCLPGSGAGSSCCAGAAAGAATGAAVAAAGMEAAGVSMLPGVEALAQQIKLSPFTYQGSMRYASTEMEVTWVLGQILLAKPAVCGFDIEWRPQFITGEAPNKTALIQICYCPNTAAMARLNAQVDFTRGAKSMPPSDTGNAHPPGNGTGSMQMVTQAVVGDKAGTCVEPGSHIPIVQAAERQPQEEVMPAAARQGAVVDPVHNAADGTAAAAAPRPAAPVIDLSNGKDCCCLLLHVAHTGIPPVLRKLLESSSIAKAGVNITGDAHKLRSDFGLELGGLLELGSLANERCLAKVDLVTTYQETSSKRWSLSGLVEVLLHRTLPKPNNIRCGNWELRPLKMEQQRYAAQDAFASLAVYCALMSRPLKDAL